MPVPRPNPLHLLAGLALWCTGCPEGSDARPASPESDWGDDEAYGEPEGAAPVVFLNFGGVTLEHGPDDATQDLSTIIREPVVEVPPYDEPDSIQEVVFLVKRMWSRTDVVFVTQRPTRGDYAMVVVTPVDPQTGREHQGG